MKNFADRLIDLIKKRKSVVCVGLDPQLDQIPEFITKKHADKIGYTFEAAAHAILEFNKGIIDAVADLVPCVKPQIAFYEQFGFEGVWAYESTIEYAKEKGLLVIADAKRNDIGSTAKGYANAFLGQVDLFGGKYFSIDADAVTVTPYLGADGINPFVDACKDYGKGIFVLVKTSNNSSVDLQDQILAEGSMPIYELMGNFVESWGADLVGENGYSSVGAVVGATYPKQAAELRKIMPQTIFLVPGYGAQGASAEDVKPCFNEDGMGAIVNSSRGIIFAYKNEGAAEESYAEAARNAVLVMNNDLNTVL